MVEVVLHVENDQSVEYARELFIPIERSDTRRAFVVNTSQKKGQISPLHGETLNRGYVFGR